MSKIIKMLIILLSFSLSACSTHLTDLSMISNKNINLQGIDLDKLPQQKSIEGRDTKFVLLFIPLGIPKVQGALNDALLKGNGDLMIDASLYMENWWFIVGQSSLILKGTVLNTKGNSK